MQQFKTLAVKFSAQYNILVSLSFNMNKNNTNKEIRVTSVSLKYNTALMVVMLLISDALLYSRAMQFKIEKTQNINEYLLDLKQSKYRGDNCSLSLRCVL